MNNYNNATKNNDGYDEDYGMDEERIDASAENMKEIKEFGATPGIQAGSDIYCLSIIGQVEGHMMLPPSNKATKYEHIIPLLAAIELDEKIKGLLVTLNTMGGDVEAGLAISEMIAGMSKPTVSLVLGGGHSIGVPLAVASDYSYIAPSATMTIHPIRMSGVVIGAIQTYDYFEKVQQRVLNFVASNSRIDENTLRSLMLTTGEIANDVGTILFGSEAVELGVIDAVGSISDAVAKLRAFIAEREAVDTVNS